MFGTDCAVCGTGSSIRDRVVDAILLDMARTGSFQVKGIGAFWSQHAQFLCSSCTNDLWSLNHAKEAAMSQLVEAVKLDSRNDSARSNLDTLKKML
jgi:hypothetical protein